MFSVDNFYTIFNSHYGWDKTQVMPYKFSTNGSKNFDDLIPLYDEKQFLKNVGVWNMYGSMALHDQEPFMINVVDTYYTRRVESRKYSGMPHFTIKEYLTVSPGESTMWPIICHSEENSTGIQYLTDLGMIECHYFWHGLVARDWFRHWKHHAGIVFQSTWSYRFLLYARSCTGSRQYRQQVIDLLRPIQLQVKHDWQNQSNISSDASATIDTKDCDSAIHLVAETVFDQRVHLTEKIFKPIVMLQPFIVFAGPGSLKYLQRYGFQTFNSIWDESYDDEPDHNTRLEKIIKLIYELSHLDKQEFQKKLAQCQTILLHNQQHFFSDQFEKMLLQELDTNVKASIISQQAKVEQDPGGPLFKMHNRFIKAGYPTVGLPWGRFMLVIQNLQQHQPKRYTSICKQYPWVGNIT
jgi:hypothetical protein